MDEHIEHGDDTSAVARSAFGRREMLQRTGFVVGAAALWNTPIVKSISLGAAAASPPEDGTPLCIEPDGTFECFAGDPPQSITFRFVMWTAGPNIYRPFMGGEFDPGDCPQTDVGFYVAGKTLDDVDSVEVYKSKLQGAGSPVRVLSGGEIVVNYEFTITNNPAAWTSFRFLDDAGALIASFEVHTSCSQYLAVGDEFAFVRVVSG